MVELTDKSHLSGPDRLHDPLPTAENLECALMDRSPEDGLTDLQVIRNVLSAYEARIRELERELHRWQHGVEVEGDYVCPAMAELVVSNDRIRELEQKLEERETAMHMRIRAEYDTTVAKCWREKVEELEQAAEARERQVREVLVRMRDETRLLDMGPWKTVDFWASELGIDLDEEG